MNLKAVLPLLLQALFVTDFVVAFPAPYAEFEDGFNSTYQFDNIVPGLPKRQNDKVALRILPLGASIVYGGDSTDKNGYDSYIAKL